MINEAMQECKDLDTESQQKKQEQATHHSHGNAGKPGTLGVRIMTTNEQYAMYTGMTSGLGD